MAEKGITLIEIIITITILAILASAIIPLSHMTVKRTKEMELRQNLRAIRTAIDDYKKAWSEGKIKKSIEDSGYPPDLRTLEEGVDDASAAQSGKKIMFIRRIPRDPMNEDATLKPAETWGLRSYQSGPDEPEEGEDVYDIYSNCEDIAIDGTPYRSW